MSQRPAPPQPLKADKSGGDRSFDRWLFLFYSWLKNVLQGVVDAASGNVFYSDGAGNITSEAAFNYNATTNALSVGSVSATTTLAAGTIVTAGTGITATTGNITATAGNFILTAGYIDLAEISDPGYAAANHALMHAEDVAGITQIHHNTSGHKWTIGQDNWMVARNTSGGVIGQLKAVYVTGSTGARPEIALADADLHHRVVGITQDSMANNAYGAVVIGGFAKGVDTSAWAAGTALYLSSTAGELTSTKPTFPAAAVHVGIVLYQHATQGILLVTPDEDDRNADGAWGTPFSIGDGTTAGELRLLEPSGTQYTAFKAQAQAGNVTYILPAAHATNAVLLNDGSGNLSWDTNISDLIDHGQLTGLGDDDHTQYALRSILTTDGDLVTRAAGVWARIGIGTDAQVLTVVSGAPAWADAAGGGGSTLDVAQSTHGFAVGDVLYHNGTIYAKAAHTSEALAEVIGIVSEVTDADNFVLLTGGPITGLSGLTAGTVYFLSSTAGALTATEPTTAGYISKPLLVAYSTTAGIFFNMRGQEIGGGVAGVREITSGTATAGQTSISATYTPGYVDVYVNGVRLLADDYVATSGSAIVLDTGMALNDEWVVVVWSVVALAQIVAPTVPGGRLTLATATPVMATEQAAKQTVYYTPYVGDLIPIYDGTSWNMKRFAELTLSMAGSANWAANSNYDLYVYNDGGTLRLGTGAAWTSDTARNESLTLLNGIYVNAATMTLRYGASSTVSVAANRATYVGTMRTTGNTGETTWELGGLAADGDPGKLFLWNCYNRALVDISVRSSTDSWSYSTATFRSANAATSYRVSFVIGIGTDTVAAAYKSLIASSGGPNGAVGVGLDSTSAYTGETGLNSTTTGLYSEAHYVGFPGIGFHYVQALEYATGATLTFYGDAGVPSYVQSGLRLKGMF